MKKGNGRRSTVLSSDNRGKYISFRVPSAKTNDIALLPTIKTAALNQFSREKNDMIISVKNSDIREKKRIRKIGNTIIFVVDCSGSMGVAQRMRETKAAIISLLIDAYQKRDKVALITFKQNSAELILPPTSSVELAKKRLEIIPTGGKSPLAHGLMVAEQCIGSELKKQKDCKPLLILISDGRANVSINKNMNPIEEVEMFAGQIRMKQIESIVIDTENGFVRLEKLVKIADKMGAKYMRIEDLKADDIIRAIQ